MERDRVAIVDPYSSGALLAPALAARGHESVAVQTRTPAPELFRRSFARGDFAAVVRLKPGAAQELRRLGVGYVVAGSEPGVEAADELAAELGLERNADSTRAARRDKALMASVLSSAGVPVPAGVASAELGEVQAWARARGTWPVVAKPPRGVASDSVAVCPDQAELRRAFAAIHGRRNVLGLVNDAVLVQEHVRGPEYAVDTVSVAGRHRVAAFWRYHAPSGPRARPGVFYEAIELLPYDGGRQNALLACALQALDAIGVRTGPAHTELIWADGRGPVVIEVGARLSAGSNAVLSRTCGGPCALDLTVDALVDRDRFASEPEPRLEAAAANCFVVRPERGRLRPQPDLEPIRELSSFREVSISRRPGQRPIVGVVTLVHPDRRALRRDIARLRELERDLFEP